MAAKKEETAAVVPKMTEVPSLAGIAGMEELVGAGLEGLEASDLSISIPFITLAQPTSKIVAESRGKIAAGNFLFRNGDETITYADPIPVTIICVGKQRTMWAPNFKRGDSPLCRSLDGVTMISGGAGSGNCKTCKFAKYNPDTKSSQCNNSYVCLCQNLDTKELFRVQLGGYAWKDAKEFFRSLNSAMLAAKAATFSFETTLSAEFVTNDKGSFFKAVLGPELKSNHLLYTGQMDDAHPFGIDMEYLNEIKEVHQSYTDSIKSISENADLEQVSNYDSYDAMPIDDEDDPF